MPTASSEPLGPDEGTTTPSNASVLDAAEVVDGEVADSRRVVPHASFVGPLPPDLLLAYDEVDPGLKRTIVDQWKSETRHRQDTIDALRKTDHMSMLSYYAGEKRAQYLSFFVLLVGDGDEIADLAPHGW
jgi:hypothetical protein